MLLQLTIAVLLSGTAARAQETPPARDQGQPFRLEPGDFRWVPFTVRQTPAEVDCHFEVIEGNPSVDVYKRQFSGGFLGLDNVGIFDRSKPLPNGGVLEQADGSAWMAFYCTTMLAIALELASEDPAYEDVASKFFEHFVAITDAMNTLGGTGLWNEDDGFYYDQVRTCLLYTSRCV